jgi:hypothetical protein
MVSTLAEAVLNEQLTKNSCLNIILIKRSLCQLLSLYFTDCKSNAIYLSSLASVNFTGKDKMAELLYGLRQGCSWNQKNHNMFHLKFLNNFY